MTGECCQGQTICKSCLNQRQHRRRATRCPVCNKEGNRNLHPNYPIEREINSLKVYCTNKEKGCEWQGELNDINNHLGNSDGCWFEKVKCSNECGKMIERQILNKIHVETECPRRKVNCQYCHVSGEHQFIEGQHKEKCDRLSLPCPNSCEVRSILHKDMEAHRKECPLEMVQCEYHNVGCKQRLPRKDLEEHKKQKMEEHLMMTKNVLAETNAQLSIALSSLMALMNVQLSKSSTTTNVWLACLDATAATVKLAIATGNQMCPVTVKMDEYFDKKVNKKMPWYSESFYSNINGYNMCLCIDAAGVLDGEATHLSVFLYLMKGSHDDELTWPLRGKFEIKLFNQISDSEHHSEIITFGDNVPDKQRSKVTQGDRANYGYGQHQFISNKRLHKTTSTRQYLRDDCLFFQVTKL